MISSLIEYHWRTISTKRVWYAVAACQTHDLLKPRSPPTGLPPHRNWQARNGWPLYHIRGPPEQGYHCQDVTTLNGGEKDPFARAAIKYGMQPHHEATGYSDGSLRNWFDVSKRASVNLAVTKLSIVGVHSRERRPLFEGANVLTTFFRVQNLYAGLFGNVTTFQHKAQIGPPNPSRCLRWVL